jgi:hypothetical protein
VAVRDVPEPDGLCGPGPGKMARVREDLSFHGSLDPDEWRRWARAWREAGRFDEALRAYEWYHAHALDLDEDAYGVRLSFLLWDWVRLAEVYPPARDSLTRLRAEAADAAVGHPPNREAFQDALAIDWAFKDEATAYDLIGRVEAEHGVLHEYYNSEVFRLLSAHGEYRRCRRWMADPTRELDSNAEIFEFEQSPENHERIRERAADCFVDRVIGLVVVLLGAGDTVGAEELVRRAGRHVDHPRLSDALEEALRILEEKPPVGA